MTLREDVSDIGNVNYTFSDDGIIGYGHISDGTIFMFDADLFSRIKDIKWYVSYKSRKGRQIYIVDCHGRPLHQVLFSTRKGMELDHINLDTLDNRRCNVRFCTHQQNQINQPLQKNNTSGVSGVSYYPPRKKYRARIKISQLDIHLGYYDTFQEAVQARNVGMECMFGEYGRYNNVPAAPIWIRSKVIEKCKRFAELSVCRAFLLSCDKAENNLEVTNE